MTMRERPVYKKLTGQQVVSNAVVTIERYFIHMSCASKGCFSFSRPAEGPHGRGTERPARGFWLAEESDEAWRDGS